MNGLLFIIIILFASLSSGASKTQTNTYLCSKCNFDTNLTILPKSFLGHNIKEIYNETVIIPKSEFETTEHYNSRIKSKHKVIYSFVTKIGADYDADSSRFTILIQSGHTICTEFTEEDNQNTFNILINTETSYYTGQNAFGVNKRITKIRTYDYSIQSVNDKTNGPGLISINLPPEKAKSAKSNFRLLYICSTDLPEGIGQNEVMLVEGKPDKDNNTGFSSKNPTFSDPEEDFNYFNTIKVILKQIWLFDYSLGLIYKKYNAEGQEL